jgi:hypothetical protein
VHALAAGSVCTPPPLALLLPSVLSPHLFAWLLPLLVIAAAVTQAMAARWQPAWSRPCLCSLSG